MAKLPLTIACGDYDRTRAIKDGATEIEGCEVNYLPLYPEEAFFRAFKYTEFDVSELSFSSYIRTTAAGTSEYIGIPAFVSRLFRHSGIYVRVGSGIEKPEDLRGKRVGLPEYQITAVVWMRGMLQHEYGVNPSEIEWHSGGQEEAGRSERTPLRPIPGVNIKAIPDDKTLVAMLEAGELDALFTARAPSSFLKRQPHIRRLFPKFRETERDYYEKTGLFPIMHLIGIKKTLTDKHPWVATSVYKAFVEAKAIAVDRLHDVNALLTTLPWLVAETEQTEDVMGRDFWRYGVKENAKEIDALTTYAFEQGLVDRKLTAHDLFHPSMFEISKV
jgi:4,5-dihydroxyphthalate decarboxylase